MNFKRFLTRDRVICIILGVMVIATVIYFMLNPRSKAPEGDFVSEQIVLDYDKEIWTVEDQSDSKGTYVCFTNGEAKLSKIGLVLEAYPEVVDPLQLVDMYKTSFAETFQGKDMRLASQASSDKSWASLSGTCIENSKQADMNFNVQITATGLGTYVSVLMWELDTPEDIVLSAHAILDTIVQLESKPPEDISEKTMDELTESDLANMTWEEMEGVMRRSFEFTTFKTISYHDGAYMAVTLDGTEPDSNATERTSSAQGITFTQRLGNISELTTETLELALRMELEQQGSAFESFKITGISESEDSTQAAAFYTYIADDIDYVGVTTYQTVGSDAYVANNILLDGSGVSDDAEMAFRELCVLLQISITMEDLENASN